MKLSIPLSEISSSGTEKVIDNQAIWTDSIEEFNVSCTIVSPLSAKLFLLKQEEGCLIRGELKGKVELPCDRCSEKTLFEVSAKFEEFELLPNVFDDETEDEEEFDKASLIYLDAYSNAHIDIATLLWEEFSLALPIKPLCKEECSGMCPLCGANLNTTSCGCDTQSIDPRLEKLKNFKVKNT